MIRKYYHVIVFIVFTALCLLLGIGALYLSGGTLGDKATPNPQKAAAVYEIDTYLNKNAETYKKFDPDNIAYKMAVNQEGLPIFKDPEAARQSFEKDYRQALESIRKQYKLHPFSKRNYTQYGVYGWQLNTENAALRQQGSRVSQFVSIYKNSF